MASWKNARFVRCTKGFCTILRKFSRSKFGELPFIVNIDFGILWDMVSLKQDLTLIGNHNNKKQEEITMGKL